MSIVRSMALFCATATLVASAHAVLPKDVRYIVVDNGVLGLGLAINDNGTVAGQTGSNQEKAFRADDSLANLQTLFSDGAGAYVNGMNNLGQVAGYRWAPDGMGGMATVWGADGSVTTLPTFGGLYGLAEGLNDSGDVVGYADLPGDSYGHAFVYHDGVMTDLTPNCPSFSVANAINADGLIVGGYAPVANGPYRPFMVRNGVFHDLGLLPGGVTGMMTAVNASGWMVGYADVRQSSHRSQGSVYHAIISNGTRLRDIGTLFGLGYAFAINDSGVVVGMSADWSHMRGWVWSEGRMLSLTHHLDASSAGWIIERANGINSQGEIVGTGLIGGVEHAIVLKPVAQ